MVEHSKGFRTGRIQSISPREWLQGTDNAKTPYVILRMHSVFPIGFGEVSEEETIVLLVGVPTIEWWESMTPAPKTGDTILISYATLYVRNGVACMRVTDPSQVEVIPQIVASTAPSMDTYKTINARDFFRNFFAEQTNNENNC